MSFSVSIAIPLVLIALGILVMRERKGVERMTTADTFAADGVGVSPHVSRGAAPRFIGAGPAWPANAKIDGVVQLVRHRMQYPTYKVGPIKTSFRMATDAERQLFAEALAEVIRCSEQNDPNVQLFDAPTTFSGTITEMGRMHKDIGGGQTARKFGIVLRQSNGKERTLWGSDLQTQGALAKVRVGSHVTITKYGRKKITEGKAPMTLYRIEKLRNPAA